MVVIRTHDALFRFVFGEPEQMGELLRGNLPPAIAAAIDWAALRRLDGTFVDEQLKERHADLLFETRIGDQPALLFVLVEHKSGEDRFTALQLLRYVVRVWDGWLATNPKARALPPVLPFVVHHGKKAWRVPRSVRALVGLDGMPADVSTFVRALQPELLFLLDLPRGRTVLFALTSWFLERAPKADEVLRTVIARIHDSTTRKTMKSALDKLLERGELQGQRALLRSQLTTRFGAIPDEIEARLAGASADDLLAWATRILTARSLAEVFAPD